MIAPGCLPIPSAALFFPAIIGPLLGLFGLQLRDEAHGEQQSQTFGFVSPDSVGRLGCHVDSLLGHEEILPSAGNSPRSGTIAKPTD